MEKSISLSYTNVHIQNIGIVGGHGKMGSFFSNFFEKNGITVEKFGRKETKTLEEFCRGKDGVFVSVPIDETEKIIEKLGKFLTKNQFLSDFTSLKKFPMEAMAKTNAKFFGLHPMFAPTVSGGVEGQNFIVCAGNAPEQEQFFSKLFEQNGANLLHISAEEHDQLMSIVQGLSHFLDVAFIATAEQSGLCVEKIFASRSPSYALKMALAGRTLAQDANLYGNIQIQNPENMGTLEKFFTVSQELFEVVKTKNLSAFEKIFDHEKAFLGQFATKAKEESDEIFDFFAKKNSGKISHPHSLLQEERRKNGIGILGPENTFSHLAFQKFFEEEKDPIFFPSIPSLFSAFRRKEIAEIFVPLENILHGSVAETIDGMVKTKTPIAAVFEMKITPSLFWANGTQKEHITEIFSHPQALAQCSEYLEIHFPHAKIVPLSSTTAAIEHILQNPHAAAIAPPEMAKKYAVEEGEKSIANTKKNATRFAFLSEKNFSTLAQEHEGALVFSFSKDSPGSLESVLHDFSEFSINLTKIESRPTGEGFGNYIFFVGYEGKLKDSIRKELHQRLMEKTAFVNFLGEFGIFRE